MANPQTENGYTKIANEIVEYFCRYRISGEEWMCLWVILRKTWGWGKKSDKIPLSQFAQLTGLKRQTVLRALKKLESKKITGVIKNDSSYINLYKFNKDFENWSVSSKKITALKGVIKNDDKTVIKKDNRVESKKGHSKETISKEKKENKKRTFFIKPSFEDVQKYCQERNNNISPQAFLDFYNSNGWKVGKNSMKDWKAAVHTWEHRNNQEKEKYI